MPRGVQISDDLRLAIIRMDLLGVNRLDICKYTGTTLRSIQRYVKAYLEGGEYASKTPGERRRKFGDEVFTVSTRRCFKAL